MVYNKKWLSRQGVIMVTLLLTLASCKPQVSDADVKAKVETIVATHPNVVVAVKRGKVTLSGIVGTEEDRRNLMAAAKDADPQNVKEVIDDLTVATLPSDSTHTDEELRNKVDLLTKDYPHVKAEISDGIIRVSGSVDPNDMEKVKMGFEELNARQLDMSALKINQKKP